MTFCERTNFKSKLPKQLKEEREFSAQRQQVLDPHVIEIHRKAVTVPFSDNNFKEAAVEFVVGHDLVSTY